jgi:hypothetical protein
MSSFYCKVKKPSTNEVRIVTQLDDLMFNDGWRLIGYVPSSEVDPFKLDAETHERINRLSNGFVR